MIGPGDWVAVAKLVDAVRRGEARIEAFPTFKGQGPFDAQFWQLSFKVSTTQPPSAILVHGDDDALAYAERMALVWGERAAQLEKDASIEPKPERAELKRDCLSCGAVPGARCRPIHDGEREPGTWVHPIRQVEDTRDADPGNPKAIKLAQQISDMGAGIVEHQRGRVQHREAIELLAHEVLASEKLRRLGFAHHFRDLLEARDRENRLAQVAADAAYIKSGVLSAPEVAQAQFGLMKGSYTILMRCEQELEVGVPVAVVDNETVRRLPYGAPLEDIFGRALKRHGDPHLWVIEVKN